MVLAANQFKEIRAQMQAAQDNNDYELIAKLDTRLHNELSSADMKQLSSSPQQVAQLKELLGWYHSAIECYTAQQNSLRLEINARAKNKKAVGCYQSMLSGESR